MVIIIDKLTIWQQNINKSPFSQHNLISNSQLANMGIGIIALQEPAINAFNLTIASRDWIPVYPTTHGDKTNRTRAITLIRSNISTNHWTQLDFPSNDVTVIQLNDAWGKLTIFNIYNKGNNNDTIKALTRFYNRNRNTLEHADTGNAHILWIGGFNRHHPLWDNPNDDHLFTNEALNDAEELIEALADIGLELTLPGGITAHQHNVMKKWSRLDQVFISDHSEHLLISCDTRTDMQGIIMDHLPILMELDLHIEPTADNPAFNFREVSWDKFHKELEMQLSKLPPPKKIRSQRQLNSCCESLTEAIQKTIKVQVPVTEITLKLKRWWTKELTLLRKQANKLGRQSYRQRNDCTHTVHANHTEVAKRYDRTLKNAKQQHW
jgi:exonuclease III